MLDLSEYLKIFVSLLVIVDPLTAVPLFVTLSASHTSAERQEMARTAALVSGGAYIASVIVGEALLKFFGISISSFKIGGGIILLLMALEMMQARQILARHTPEEDREAEYRGSVGTVGAVPLGIPLLAGPGSMSSLIIYAHGSPSLLHAAALSLCCVAVAAISWVSLAAAEKMTRYLGQTGLNIVIRIMGLFLAAIAVEFIAGGVKELLPGLR